MGIGDTRKGGNSNADIYGSVNPKERSNVSPRISEPANPNPNPNPSVPGKRPSSVDKLRQTAVNNKSTSKAHSDAISQPFAVPKVATKTESDTANNNLNFSKAPDNDDKIDEDIDQIYNDIFNYHFSSSTLFSANMNPSQNGTKNDVDVKASHESAGLKGGERSPKMKGGNLKSPKKVPESMMHINRMSTSEALEIQEEVDFWIHHN